VAIGYLTGHLIVGVSRLRVGSLKTLLLILLLLLLSLLLRDLLLMLLLLLLIEGLPATIGRKPIRSRVGSVITLSHTFARRVGEFA